MRRADEGDWIGFGLVLVVVAVACAYWLAGVACDSSCGPTEVGKITSSLRCVCLPGLAVPR